MSWDSIFGKKTKKQVKHETLEKNRYNGKAAEDRFVMEQSLQGREVERTGKGSDYRVRQRDWLTGKVTSSRLYEVKSSKTAPVSKLQKKGIKKKRVTVKRYDNSNPFGFW